MNYKVLRERIEEYKKLDKEREQISSTRDKVISEIRARLGRQYTALGNNIGSFCGGSAFRSVIKGYVETSGGVISVINAGIAYRGRVLPPKPFDHKNAESVALGCVSEIKASMEGISRKIGSLDSHAQRLSAAFSTLRAIFANIDSLKMKAIESEINEAVAKENKIKERMLELLKEEPMLSDLERAEKRLLEIRGELDKEIGRFRFEDISMREDYGEEITLPIAMGDGDVCYWSPYTDGVLTVSASSREALEGSYDFVKAAIMQFLYSYPAMDKQIFYCSNRANGAMDIFLETLGDKENGVGTSLFYRDTAQLTSFGNQVSEYIGYLRDEIKERLKLIDYSGKKSVFEYNLENQATVLKPILAVLHGYPGGFGTCSDLDYIFEAGKSVGIFCLVIKDDEKKERVSYYDEAAVDPEEFGKLHFRIENGGFYIGGKRCEPVGITDAKRRALIRSLREVKKSSAKSFVSYEDLGFGEYVPKKSYSRISIPVAILGKDVYNINFVCNNDDGNYPTGYFLLGNQNAGKSSLIDAMIINGAMAYSPDELIFYLLDFKDGVSANAYTGENAIPHVRVVAQKNKEEDAGIIISNLEGEMERRNNIFKSQGKDIQSLADYNRNSEKKMPAIIVVVDECQALFKNDKLVSGCVDLIRKGRSAGIYLVLATQMIESGMTAAINLIKGRSCFETTVDNAERLIDRPSAKRVPAEVKAGTGYSFISTDLGHSSDLVRVAWHDKRISEYNRLICEKWLPLGYSINLSVAGEDKAIYIEDRYTDLSSGGLRIPFGENYFDRSEELIDLEYDEDNGCAYHTVAAFGSSIRTNTSVLASVTVGALRAGAGIKLIDTTKNGLLASLVSDSPSVQVVGKNDYLDALGDVYAEYSRRCRDNHLDYKPYFFIINGINNIGAFSSNEALKKSPPTAPGGRIDLNAFRNQSTASEDIRGKDTLFKIISGIENAPSMYIVIAGTESVIDNSSDRRIFKHFDYKILQGNVAEDAARGIMEDSFNSKMLAGINENMVCVGSEHSKYSKVRHYIFDTSKEEVRKIVRNTIEEI